MSGTQVLVADAPMKWTGRSRGGTERGTLELEDATIALVGGKDIDLALAVQVTLVPSRGPSFWLDKVAPFATVTWVKIEFDEAPPCYVRADRSAARPAHTVDLAMRLQDRLFA